eukprot:5705379-Amphidinium_carterae.1
MKQPFTRNLLHARTFLLSKDISRAGRPRSARGMAAPPHLNTAASYGMSGALPANLIKKWSLTSA